MQQFITNKNQPINFNKHIPAFVFYLYDRHVYLINDTAMRQSLLHSHSKSEILSLMIKEAKRKHDDEREFIQVDIPFEKKKRNGIKESVLLLTSQDNVW
jgi:hypothetical protein